MSETQRKFQMGGVHKIGVEGEKLHVGRVEYGIIF